MDAANAFLAANASNSSTFYPLLSILAGLRNGAYYGTKIRLPHAVVMTFLFRSGPFMDKLKNIVSLTATHTKNLALFVGLYKGALAALRRFATTGPMSMPAAGMPGRPAKQWHALAAGAVGGYFIWGKYNGVNYQMIMYLLSRVLIAFANIAAEKKIPPFTFTFKQTYPWLATVVWAAVMWQFEYHRYALHSSLAKSMDFLYHDSAGWPAAKISTRLPPLSLLGRSTSPLSGFLPSPATAAIIALVYVWDISIR